MVPPEGTRDAANGWPGGLPAPIDVLLGQADPESLAHVRAHVAADLGAALVLAETVELVEHCRTLRIAASPRLQAVLSGLQSRLRRQQRLRVHPPVWPRVAVAAVAASVAFAGLVAWDPLRAPADAVAQVAASLPQARPMGESVVAMPSAPVEHLVEPGLPAVDAVPVADRGQGDRSPGDLRVRIDLAADPLGSWVRPGNALSLLRVDYELRASSELRRRAQQDRGGLPEVEDRVQRLADGIRAELGRQLASGRSDPKAIALAVRALLASGTAGPGGRHADALASGADWLIGALPGSHGGDLAVLLGAVAEVAASTGRGAAAVAEHGPRLVAEAGRAEAGAELFSPSTSAMALGEAGRFLAWAPGFGVDASAASMLRVLLVSSLQQRRRDVEHPDVLAAIAYGFGDLLGDDARRDVERRLMSWKVSSLVPDYSAMHQLAWSRRPELPGFTRFQLDLRRVAAVATPEDLAGRSALCLCLATNFAAPGVSGLHDVAD